jgi:hypothetical protein
MKTIRPLIRRKTAHLLALLSASACTCIAIELPQSGLALHLDAASIEGVTHGALLTTAWEDQSENNLNAVNSSGTYPTYVEGGGSSSYPAVRFDGVNQYLRVDSLALGSDVSVFVVFANRATPQANDRETLLAWPVSGGGSSLASSRSASSVPDYPSLDVQSTGSVVGSWVNGHHTDATTGDLFADRIYVGSAVYADLSSSTNLLIGSSSLSGTYAGQNDILEILIYNRALNEAERHQVHAYLGSKYDIEVVQRSMDHPVESYPHPLGSQQFGTQYSFGQDGIRTLDYAKATLRMGTPVVKFRLSNKYSNTDGFTAVSGINTLTELVRDQPEIKEILDMPLTDYVFWVSSFSVSDWTYHLDDNGLNPTKEAQIYSEVYALVSYLLETYSGSGKRFYIGNWEGDWKLAGNYKDDPNTIPQNRIQGMIDWANIRQQAVDDAKANTAHSDVDVWYYLEMNKADWMRQGLPCVANSVIPAMPKLDMVSISSYTLHKDNGNPRSDAAMHADLDQVQALLDAKPDASIPGSRLMIGEYGWQYSSTTYSNLTDFADRHVTTARSYFKWQGGTLRFIFQWQFYNQAAKTNGDPKEMSLIGPSNDLRPLYYMHENSLRTMRRWVDDYYTRTGELPSERAYADHADLVLSNVALQEYEPVYAFASYSDWRDYYFVDPTELQDSAVSGPSADPYQSGLPNLLRYGLGVPKFGAAPSRMPHLRQYTDSMVYAIPFDTSKTDLRWTVQAGSTLGQWSTLFDSQSYIETEAYSEDFEAIDYVVGSGNYSYGYDKDPSGGTYAAVDFGTWYKSGSTSGVSDVDGDGDNEIRPNLSGKNNAKMWGVILDPTLFAATGSGNYVFDVDLIGADSGTSKIYLWYARNFDTSGSNDLFVDAAQGGLSTFVPAWGSGATEVGEIFNYDIPDETANGSYSTNFNYTAGDALILVFGSYNTAFAYDNVSIKRRELSNEGLTIVDGFVELNADAIEADAEQMFYRLQLQQQ